MYDLGDPVPLTVQIADVDGNPANAGAVTVTVTPPNGVTVTPLVVNPSAGLYQSDYLTTQPGRHTVRWVATGINASAFSDAFEVNAATPSYLVSLADAKRYLNITTSTNDEELRTFIESATQVVEDIVGPVVVRTVTETHTRPGRVIILQQPPIISLISLTSSITGGLGYDASVLDIDPVTGIVRRLDGLPLGSRAWVSPVPLRAVYTAGRPIVPAAISMAANVIIDHLWETQRGHAQGVRPTPGGGRSSPKKGPAPTLPHRALELLRPFRRTPAVF